MIILFRSKTVPKNLQSANRFLEPQVFIFVVEDNKSFQA